MSDAPYVRARSRYTRTYDECLKVLAHLQPRGREHEMDYVGREMDEMVRKHYQVSQAPFPPAGWAPWFGSWQVARDAPCSACGHWQITQHLARGCAFCSCRTPRARV